MDEFKSVIENTQRLLLNNTEWIERYGKYAKSIISNIKSIKNKKEKFNQWAPLYLYMSISEAKGDASTFNLRYLGQTVASLNISQNNVVILNTSGFSGKNIRDFGCKVHTGQEGVDWNSDKAAEFRKHFSKYPSRAKGGNKSNEEHGIESMLLTEFSKTARKDKIYPYIQPVRIAKIARFQMPTPFKASEGEAEYAKLGKGGGIDIMARIGKGKGRKLCIMEIKDEYLEKEPPKAAIKQGLIYATFIRELLRSECGNSWWKIYGLGKDIPKKLVLYVACVMPFSVSIEKTDKSFSGRRLNIGKDVFELHYIYFNEEKKIEYVETSLQKKQ